MEDEKSPEFEQPEVILAKLENLLKIILIFRMRNIEEEDIQTLGKDLPIILKSVEFFDTFKQLETSITEFNKLIQAEIKSPTPPPNVKKRAKNKGPKTIQDIKIDKKYPSITNGILSLLPDYIRDFKTGLASYSRALETRETKIQESRASALNITDIPTIALYIHCHGQSVIACKRKINTFELFEPDIQVLKFTAAPLCMTFGSTQTQDQFIAECFIILDEWYKSTKGKSIFAEKPGSIIVANYIICEFYKEYACNIYKHLCPNEIPKNDEDTLINAQGMINILHGAINHAIIARGGYLYTYPVSNAAIYRLLLFDDPNASEDLKRRITTKSNRNSAPNFPSRVTITNPISDKKKQRNKIFAVEDTSDEKNAVSLDIKILNSFRFSFPGDSRVIHVGAGESLLKLLFDWYYIPNPAYDPDPSKQGDPANRRYAQGPYYNQINDIAVEYDGIYPPRLSPEADIPSGGRRAHDFNPSYAHSSIRIGIYTTITSISLRFLLFFFKRILGGPADEFFPDGHVTIFDFSCGFLDYDAEGNEQPEEVA